MSHLISLPPASQWFFQMALSPSIVTKSRPWPASSRSRSVAVTSIVSLRAKREAVSRTTANTSGRCSLSLSSRVSSMFFSSLSIFSQMGWRSSKGIVSTCSRRVDISVLSSRVAAFRSARTASMRLRSSSLERLSSVGSMALILSTMGIMALRSRCDLLPKILLSTCTNDMCISFCGY